MPELHDESIIERLRGDGLLLLFVLTCVLLVCAWQARTNTLLWGLALGALALHDLMVLAAARRRSRTSAALQAATSGR